MKAKEKIGKAIIDLVYRKMPFYAEMLLRTNIKEFSEQHRKSANFSPTMAVDLAGNILYDEEFIHSMSHEELKFVLLHEVNHKVFLHVQRGVELKADVNAWNVAADIVVDYEVLHNQAQHSGAKPMKNRIIADSYGKITLNTPKGELVVYDVGHKSVEEIYGEVKPYFESKKSGNPLGTEIDSHLRSGDGESKVTKKDLKRMKEKILDEVAQSAAKAKHKGDLPAGLERMIEKLLRGKINWRGFLWRWLTNALPKNYTWSKPNRRHLWSNLILPSRRKKGLNLAVLIDTSGSIDGKELEQFISECNHIMAIHNNVKMTIIVHDVDVHNTYEVDSFTPFDFANIKLEGCGGTSHIPSFKWLKKNKNDIKHIICFTDGYTSFPDEELRLGKDVLWVLTSKAIDNDNIPFGDVVRFEK